jgi:hypothetical protein
MNAQIQKVLSGLAQCAGLTIEFPDGAHIRISGFQDEPTFVLISSDQSDSELIFAILQKIGTVAAGSRDFPLPWFLNRPYEIEFAGEVTYKTRRKIRQKFNPEKRADLWALCAYSECGWLSELRDYLKQHPEKIKMTPFILCALILLFTGRS